ncbi:MAG: Carbon-nitrogen hydrolase [Caeruleum heppii]|nr:MAG: Carbon-nitrogen hydrolase [Caeruleum heppii]
MRIALLQFSPVLSDVAANIRRADEVLREAGLGEGQGPGEVDLLMLPEMAFSGYNHTPATIAPLLEPTPSTTSTSTPSTTSTPSSSSFYPITPPLNPTTQPTLSWALNTAVRLQCHLTIGYPELWSSASTASADPSSSSSTAYNSALLISPTGEVLRNYRKTFLYYTDEAWAAEGPQGFETGEVEGLGRVCMGICMDINPYRFLTPFTTYEFATHAVRTSATLILLTNAWLTSSPSPCPPSHIHSPHIEALSYWLARLEPIIRKSATSEEEQEEEEEDEGQRGREVLVAICNRAGSEEGAHYAGSSVVLGIKEGRVRMYGGLGEGEERVLVVDTEEEGVGRVLRRRGGDEDDHGDKDEDEENTR